MFLCTRHADAEEFKRMILDTSEPCSNSYPFVERFRQARLYVSDSATHRTDSMMVMAVRALIERPSLRELDTPRKTCLLKRIEHPIRSGRIERALSGSHECLY